MHVDRMQFQQCQQFKYKFPIQFQYNVLRSNVQQQQQKANKKQLEQLMRNNAKKSKHKMSCAFFFSG